MLSAKRAKSPNIGSDEDALNKQARLDKMAEAEKNLKYKNLKHDPYTMKRELGLEGYDNFAKKTGYTKRIMELLYTF